MAPQVAMANGGNSARERAAYSTGSVCDEPVQTTNAVPV